MNLQQRVAAVILRWPWEADHVPHGWDIQGQIRRQGGEAALPSIVAALEALAKEPAIRLGPPIDGGNRQILEVFPARLRALVP